MDDQFITLFDQLGDPGQADRRRHVAGLEGSQVVVAGPLQRGRGREFGEHRAAKQILGRLVEGDRC
ncbi:hypothetical protein [Acidimicrobium ferrooxidans]|uniref:hypothetical protein n=1 Tax=Acidimicrobium ferrooxidans TaxID=53635 RepID=UPI00117BEA35|nr:hypothetical protein [Acidimicrobium ferrooxidans]